MVRRGLSLSLAPIRGEGRGEGAVVASQTKNADHSRWFLQTTFNSWFQSRPAGLLLAAVLGCFLAGCSSDKPETKAPHQRGWIGGEYEVAGRGFGPFSTRPEVHGFPKALKREYHSGLLITALATNTPAQAAGLRAGDLILEVDYERTHRVRDLRRVVDESKPGTVLPVKAYRDGVMVDCNVTVGRETFWHEGSFMFGLYVNWIPDLWPDPGFSLLVVSFQPSKQPRTELGSVKSVYLKNVNDGKYEPVDEDWNAWLGVIGVSKSKRIVSQEIVPARTADLPVIPVGGNASDTD